MVTTRGSLGRRPGRGRRALGAAPGAVLALLVAALGGPLAMAQPPASPAPPEAAEPQAVTLGQALKQSLRDDNPALEQQNDNVQIAAGRVQEAKGAFDWNTTVQSGWQQLYVAKPSNGFLTSQTEVTGTYYTNATIGRRFRNGVEVAPGISAFYGSGATPAQTAGYTQVRPLLGLKVPLLRGAGTGAADAQERAAKDAFRSSRMSRDFAVEQLVQTVASTFWRCVADDQLLDEARAADAHAATYAATLADLQRKGILEPTVVQQWAANNAIQHLVVGRAEDEGRRCRRDLSYAMTGRPEAPWPDVSGELPQVDALTSAVGRLDEKALVDLALDRRPDVQAAMGYVVAARENVRLAKDSAKPTLDLHLDPQNAFVGFSKAFGNNLAKGKEVEAEAQEDQAEVSQRQLEDQVRTQVGDAVENLQRSASDWANLDAAEKQMEGVIGDAEKRARFGVINWGDFLNAQNQLSELKRQVIYARLNFAVDLTNLWLATGTIDAGRPDALAADLARLPSAGPA